MIFNCFPSLGDRKHSGRICVFFCGPSFSKTVELGERKEREGRDGIDGREEREESGGMEEREEGEGREIGHEWKVWEVWEVITVTSYPGKYPLHRRYHLIECVEGT